MKVRLRVGKPIVKKEVFYVSIDQIEKQDRDEQKRISLIVKKLYERVLEDDPKSKIKKILVQFWLMSVAEQNLNGMNDRQIGKIKWNDKGFKRYDEQARHTRCNAPLRCQVDNRARSRASQSRKQVCTRACLES